MSSESSDDMSCGICSQDSNANVAPSWNENPPTLQFASLCLNDHESSARWRSQEDSDYDSDYNATYGKRKQRSQESETDVQQKKLKKDEETDCQETDSECQVQSQKSDPYEDCEADDEEEEELESEEESSEECDGVCCHEPDFIRMDAFATGMKRKTVDTLESPTVPKLKRSS